VVCQVINSVLLTVSVMGNFGTFTKRWHHVLIDFNFVYHAGYVIISVLGLCVHEFFYSFLVSGLAPRGREFICQTVCKQTI